MASCSGRAAGSPEARPIANSKFRTNSARWQMRHLRFAIFYLLFAILDELRANSPPESWNLTMPIAPNLSKPRQTIGFRTSILQLVLGALLFSVGTIAIVGYLNSERTLEEIRQKHFVLVSLTL